MGPGKSDGQDFISITAGEWHRSSGMGEDSTSDGPEIRTVLAKRYPPGTSERLPDKYRRLLRQRQNLRRGRRKRRRKRSSSSCQREASAEMTKEVSVESAQQAARDYSDPPPAPLFDLGELRL